MSGRCCCTSCTASRPFLASATMLQLGPDLGQPCAQLLAHQPLVVGQHRARRGCGGQAVHAVPDRRPVAAQQPPRQQQPEPQRRKGQCHQQPQHPQHRRQRQEQSKAAERHGQRSTSGTASTSSAATSSPPSEAAPQCQPCRSVQLPLLTVDAEVHTVVRHAAQQPQAEHGAGAGHDEQRQSDEQQVAGEVRHGVFMP